MKKTILLLGSLLGVIAVSSQMEAKWGDIAWVKIKNRTPWKLNVWWKGHTTYNNEANSIVLHPSGRQSVLGRIFLLRANRGAMRGPLYVSREQVGKKVGTHGEEQQYYDIFETPKNAPFFPINYKGQIYRVLTLVKDASGVGIRVKQTWPEIQFFGFGRKPFVEMKRKRVKIKGQEELIK